MEFLPIVSDQINYKNILCTWRNNFVFRLKCKTEKEFKDIIKNLQDTNKLYLNDEFNLEFKNIKVKEKFIQDLQRL